MLRLASLAFVLRAGVKYTSGHHLPSRFRTVQARVDTILYQRLKLAEQEHCQLLQKMIFRKAGNLTRQQVYPVALVLWQLMRILCIAASHLSNITQRFRDKRKSSSPLLLPPKISADPSPQPPSTPTGSFSASSWSSPRTSPSSAPATPFSSTSAISSTRISSAATLSLLSWPWR